MRRSRCHVLLTLALCVALSSASAATRYVAPGGTGQGASEDSPLGSLSSGVSSVGPGDTLVLLDGEYRESLRLTKSGTPGSPITVMAKNVGGAFINGEGTRVPVQCWQQTRWNLDGLRAGNSSGAVYDLNYCYHFRITRCAGFDAAGAESDSWTNNHIFNIAYADSVFAEDVWAWGGGRYSFIYYVCSGCHIRRGVFFPGPYRSGPHAGLAVYCSDHTLVENVLAFGARLGSPTFSCCVSGFVCEGHDCPQDKSSRDNEFYGCIAIDNGQVGQISTGMFVWNEFQGAFEDMVSWNNTGSAITVAGSTGNTMATRSLEGDPTNVISNTGPQVLTRYVDGELTGESLWPWPYEELIEVDFGMQETVTEYVRRQLDPYIIIPQSGGVRPRPPAMAARVVSGEQGASLLDIRGRAAVPLEGLAPGVYLSPGNALVSPGLLLY